MFQKQIPLLRYYYSFTYTSTNITKLQNLYPAILHLEKQKRLKIHSIKDILYNIFKVSTVI